MGEQDIQVLVLGSKEYPFGSGDDPLRSGGMEVYAQHLIEHLRGHVRLLVVTRRFTGLAAREVVGGVEVHRVPWLRGFYLRNPSFNLAAFFRALRLRWDVLLTLGAVASLAGVLLSRLRRKPVVACPSGIACTQPQYPAPVRRVLRWIERCAYARADAVVFLSEQERESFREKLGFLPGRWYVVPPGVRVPEVGEEQVAKLREELGVRGVMVCFAGRLVGVKGVDVLIRAVSMCRSELTLVVAGDGPERERLELLAEELGVSERVRFLGWVSGAEVLLSACDVFVLPSYSEGLPMALVEAMAAGRACVVTDIGLPVVHGVTGLVVRAGDAGALAEALDALAEDEGLRRRLGEEAREWVRRELRGSGRLRGMCGFSGRCVRGEILHRAACVWLQAWFLRFSQTAQR
ncbi:MAG: glycosyltransferase family 4 protein [Euryarchaeota archaeon]|nr:glycosyltransferase family 4 protein [Euryarchaeota archaeon]